MESFATKLSALSTIMKKGIYDERLLIDKQGRVAGVFLGQSYVFDYDWYSDLDLYLLIERSAIFLINREFGKDKFWLASELPWRDNKWITTSTRRTHILYSNVEMEYVESIPDLVRSQLISGWPSVYAPKNEKDNILQFLREHNMFKDPL